MAASAGRGTLRIGYDDGASGDRSAGSGRDNHDAGRLDAVIADASQGAAGRSAPVGVSAGRGVGVDPDGHVIKQVAHVVCLLSGMGLKAGGLKVVIGD